MTPEDRLRIALNGGHRRKPIEVKFTDPPGPYEHETRQMVEKLDRELIELRQETRRLLYTIIGGVFVSIVLQLVR